jgi:hypothetical protein
VSDVVVRRHVQGLTGIDPLWPVSQCQVGVVIAVVTALRAVLMYIRDLAPTPCYAPVSRSHSGYELLARPSYCGICIAEDKDEIEV